MFGNLYGDTSWFHQDFKKFIKPNLCCPPLASTLSQKELNSLCSSLCLSTVDLVYSRDSNKGVATAQDVS